MTARLITRVVHCRRAPFDVYIGRAMPRFQLPASKWGNPFRDEDSLARYAAWLHTQPQLVAAVGELRGQVLGCWCADAGTVLTAADEWICHGQVLAYLADTRKE